MPLLLVQQTTSKRPAEVRRRRWRRRATDVEQLLLHCFGLSTAWYADAPGIPLLGWVPRMRAHAPSRRRGSHGLHDWALNMPVAVSGLDVDAAAGVIRGEQHRRLPAATLPAEQDVLGRRARGLGLSYLPRSIIGCCLPAGQRTVNRTYVLLAEIMDVGMRCQGQTSGDEMKRVPPLPRHGCPEAAHSSGVTVSDGERRAAAEYDCRRDQDLSPHTIFASGKRRVHPL